MGVLGFWVPLRMSVFGVHNVGTYAVSFQGTHPRQILSIAIGTKREQQWDIHGLFGCHITVQEPLEGSCANQNHPPPPRVWGVEDMVASGMTGEK